MTRPEDIAFQALLSARLNQATEWPEPETSDLYKSLRLGALHIIAQTLHRRERDLASEIATHVLLHLRTFKGHSLFSTWFYRIVRNSITDWVRNEARRSEVQISIVPEPVVLQPVPNTLKLPKLTPSQADLLERISLGESMASIAKSLGVSRQAIQSRWQRLQKYLKHDNRSV